MQTNKTAKCNKCLNKFYQKDIYTIQQFQYKKEPKYQWTIKLFEKDFKKDSTIGIKKKVLTKCVACNYIKEPDEKCPCCWGI